MLTPKQQAVLDYVESSHARHGLFPTLREIQAHFGFASPFAATRHLQALEKKGALTRHPGKARAFTLASPREPKPSLLRIPVFGVIPAGLPAANSQELEPDETVAVSAADLGLPTRSRLFGLRVHGDSMTGANIIEDDIVFLTPGEPRAGQIVAALLDGESTLKRFLHHAGRPFLRAENPRYPDLLPAEELLIQGIMVGLLRRGHGS
ncbi:transcriptional repressor LexA [Synoicihabitans lomoniglobus]|uniref:Transcriptional repressor LexA n=1 Tax=Synoicihabitans lomoniglobus TaxID=2909285 RepID=A0AAE9ZQZ8_9BACT|nr:transcriptional repressor LexA [Opitutaceae bacterium LMO-M01]WED63570.1 transcriptional repressor LexA [Opitutaceae bacterium LMO-M01]